MATDVEDDDYGDEWGEEQAGNADEDGLGAGKEAVHPLATVVDKLEGCVEPASKTVDTLLKLRGLIDSVRQQGDGWEVRAAVPVATTSVSESGGDARLHGDQSVQDELPEETDNTARHTQHFKRTRPMPPPPPCRPQGHSASEDTDRLDAAALYARVAALRIVEYRETMLEKDQAMRREEAELTQRLKAIRRSNKPIYEAYGVAGLTPADRLKLSVRALKKQAKLNELAGDLERKRRWYNKQATRRDAAAAHARQLASKEDQKRRKQEKLTRDAAAQLRASQERAKQEAKARIARNTCAYVRGSYLLRALPSSNRPAADTSHDATDE